MTATLLVALLLAIALVAPASAQTTVTIRSFDEPLAPYGYWVADPTYGRVWRPRNINSEWRPYTYGRWVYTSEYGWVWESEEPWGWVVYHYGRWIWTNQYGWVWITGDVWGPSWVEWCSGGGYIGWTPMPAQPSWQSGYYYGSYDCTSPAYYSRTVYVSQDRFAGQSVSANVIAPTLNANIAAQATNVTSYSRSQEAIVNRSVDVAKLRLATGQTIKPTQIIRSQSPETPSTAAAGLQPLRLYQPKVVGRAKPKLEAGTTPKGQPEPGKERNVYDVPTGLGPSAGYPTSLPSSGAPIPSAGGLGGDGLTPPPGGGLGGAGGIGGGLRGGRRR